MGIISRLLLFLYVLVVMAILLVCGGVCLHMIPTNVWQSVLNDVVAREETIMVIGAMLVASLCLLSVVFSGKKNNDELASGEVKLKKGEAGEVDVSVAAIESVIERAAETVSGVRDVKADVYKTSGVVPIKVKLSMVLSQGCSAPQVSSSVSYTVNEALRVAFEITDVPMKLKITEITHAVADRDKRVV